MARRSLTEVAAQPKKDDVVHLFGGTISYKVVSVDGMVRCERSAVRNSPIIGTDFVALSRAAWLDLVNVGACS